MGTHAMVRGSLLTGDAGSDPRRARATPRARCHLDQLGPVLVLVRPNYNPSADGAPDEEGDRLLEVGRAIHALVRSKDPRGTFSGEMITEQKVPVLDYTWDWRNGADLGEDAPFRYVFHVRLNANVNEHPRGALLAFADGGLINVMPGQMHSHLLADHPELVETLRHLAALRRRFLRFFCEGQYHHVEGLTMTGCHARLYAHGDDVLVVLVNPPTRRHLRRPASTLGLGRRSLVELPEVVALDGASTRSGGGRLRRHHRAGRAPPPPLHPRGTERSDHVASARASLSFRRFDSGASRGGDHVSPFDQRGLAAGLAAERTCAASPWALTGVNRLPNSHSCQRGPGVAIGQTRHLHNLCRQGLSRLVGNAW